jgi:hypothetical protein
VSWIFESPHVPLSLGGRLVGILGAIVEISVLSVLNTEQALELRRAIALELIRNDHAWHIRARLEQLAEGGLRSLFIPSPVPENIQHVAVLIHRPPQRGAFAVDGEEDFIEMPRIARSGAPTPELVGIGLPELPAPIARGFVRQQ